MTSGERPYDVIVLGVGAMGSATAYHLATRGLRVLALERFDIPHTYGSSHGHTRIIRLAYFEDPAYVPLMLRAYELWRELEAQSGQRLLHCHGSLNVSRENEIVFAGSLRACQLHDVPHEVLTPSQVRERYPGYRLPDDTFALFQPDGGFLVPEACIVAYAQGAMAVGADIRAREKVIDWSPSGDGVRVTTDRGIYEAGSLVVTAGAWAADFLPLEGLAVPERQALLWLRPQSPALFTPERFPVFNIELDTGAFYGFPEFGVPGLKLGEYLRGVEAVHPDEMEREPGPEDEAPLRAFVDEVFPEASGPTMAMKTCLFTNTPDEHFILDRLPEHEQVVIGAGFSGHGFKFASVIGEILAELVVNAESSHDIDFLRLDRFSTDSSSPAEPTP